MLATLMPPMHTVISSLSRLGVMFLHQPAAIQEGVVVLCVPQGCLAVLFALQKTTDILQQAVQGCTIWDALERLDFALHILSSS